MLRVCSSTKENVQSFRGPSRSASALELDKLHSKKVKKHMSGLRRAVSNINLGTSRNFAPRTSWVSKVICSALVFVQFCWFWPHSFSWSYQLLNKMTSSIYSLCVAVPTPRGNKGGWGWVGTPTHKLLSVPTLIFLTAII